MKYFIYHVSLKFKSLLCHKNIYSAFKFCINPNEIFYEYIITFWIYHLNMNKYYFILKLLLNYSTRLFLLIAFLSYIYKYIYREFFLKKKRFCYWKYDKYGEI